MTTKVTDNLLSQYIADSGKLNSDELKAVRDYLHSDPEQADIIATIIEGLDEVDMDRNICNLSHPIAVVPFTDEEIAERCNQNRAHALEILDEIMVERGEQELIEHFEQQAIHGDNSQAKKSPQVVTLQ
jgi:hypothetical protein